MRLPIDSKFVATALLGLLPLLIIMIVVARFLDPAAATVVGAVIGGVAVKVFEKLDYTPTFSFEVGVSRSVVSWFYGAIANVFARRVRFAQCGLRRSDLCEIPQRSLH